jgi:WD40 repeat protein
LLIGTKNGQIQLWKVASDEPARSEIQLESRIASAAFFPDNQRFLVGSWDQTARVYSVSDANNATSFVFKDENLVSSVDVSPDGSMLIICLGNGTLRLWDAKTNRQIGSVMKILPRPKFAKFGWDGETILTSSPDGSTRQWDVRARTEIGPPMLQSKEITAVAQSKDGRWLATASSDWTARLWDIAPAVGSYEELKAQFELSTGSKLEKDGELQILPIEDWRRRKGAQKP